MNLSPYLAYSCKPEHKSSIVTGGELNLYWGNHYNSAWVNDLRVIFHGSKKAITYTSPFIL